MAPPAATAEADEAAAAIHTIGVVFIHGIGAQRAGETVFAWAGPIVRILGRGRRTRRPDGGRPSATRSVAEVDLTGATTPFIELEVPAGSPADRRRSAGS